MVTRLKKQSELTFKIEGSPLVLTKAVIMGRGGGSVMHQGWAGGLSGSIIKLRAVKFSLILFAK